MKLILIALATLIALSGCASTEYRQAQQQYFAAQADAVRAHSAQAQQPLLDLQMTEDGRLRSLTVGRQIGAAPQMAMPRDPNAEMLQAVVNGAVTVGSIVAGGQAARGLVTATGNAIGGALQAMPQPVVVTQPAPVQIPGAPAPEVVVVRPDVVDPVIVDPVIVPPTVVQVAQ